ncbi:MAG: hypothetical protein QNJ41_11990 [Xenococcaceae cyanobacterium MO_188.B32]|nr:hypothetical protein [Xenococcaceae cyanobacterium MO_188.B32]
MPLLPDYLKVTDLTALKALTEITERRNGEIKIVDVVASATPEYNLSDVAYRYNSASSADNLEPAIVVPDDSNGRWVMVNNPIAIATAAPTTAPAKENVRYIAILETPTRVVEWHSPPYLPATPAVEDWHPVIKAIDIGEVPTFNADFVGQLVKDTNTGWVYKAIDLTGSWVLSLPHFVYGTDVTAAETLTLEYHGQYKKVTADLTLTLPSGLVTNIEAKVIVPATITLTLSPDTGTTLNGGTGTITATNTTATVHNNGDDWFVFS